MEILTFKEAKSIPERYLPSLVDAEIECWWSEPFCEFLKCMKKGCWKLYSIQDVYWNLKSYRERKEDKKHVCECWWHTEMVYPHEGFLELAREYIKWKVSAVLGINENDEVRAFWIVSVNSLENIINFELATRPNSYDKKKLIKELSLILFWREDASEEEVSILHQIFVGEEERKGNTAFDILKQLIELNPEYSSLPVIGETRFDWDFYPILRAIWCTNTYRDRYWYVTQYLSNYSNLLEFVRNNNSFSSRQLFLEILKHKREARKIVQWFPTCELKYVA